MKKFRSWTPEEQSDCVTCMLIAIMGLVLGVVIARSVRFPTKSTPVESRSTAPG